MWRGPSSPAQQEGLKHRRSSGELQHGGLAGTGPFTPTPPPSPPPPPSLEIGWKVPDHGRQRRPKQILLELVEGEKMGFHPMCLYSKYCFFSALFLSPLLGIPEKARLT